ncbi:transglutaminase-like domain-containing protein [Streptomyces sp. N2-109]|uniref:Transglutaminase-like domain-containing protein n=1 Tax=Streptomyces gossypii TaxID=2883101 RepID=A0ABT2JVR8_9ACTN|nr:transglutaminase-like domain-containing protein [Streptomyces gossypii]MCT2591931.1 transglutaminase-like domain-containing protein [Streptomyces gossypii]
MTTDSRERFRRAATEQRPDLALLCLLIGTEAAKASAGEATEEAAGEAAGEAGDWIDAAIDSSQMELDRLAGQLPADLRQSGDPWAWAEALRRLLGEEHGFHGTTADYRRLDSSLLQAVLIRRRGLPILLSVVWIEVARRAGAPVYGVALPGHFVVGFGDPSGKQVLADPFNGGRLLAEGELDLLVTAATGGSRPVSRAMLQPADPLETVLRVLNNIRAWAAARPEHSDVQLWALDLSLLLPHHPVRLRLERSQLLVERGDFVGGARGLEEYADVVSAMEPNAADAVRRQARAARARLN